jgi:hypothetical protein
LARHAQACLASIEEEKEAAAKAKPGIDGKDLQTIDLNSVDHRNSRTVGGEALAYNALLEARLPEYLKSLTFNNSQVHAAMGNIVGRMLQPGSELSTHEWLQKKTFCGSRITATNTLLSAASAT